MGSRERTSECADTRPGVVNYLDDTTESSLFRNGKVLTRRDAEGSDAGYVGVRIEAHTLAVQDARALSGVSAKSCESNGFELLDAPLDNPSLDFLDHQQVVRQYYPPCEELVSASTGAQAFAFDHNIRSARGKKSTRRITGGQAVQGPAKMVHGDYTLYSAPQRLKDLSRPPGVNDTLRSVLPEGQSLITPGMAEDSLADDGRFAIIKADVCVIPTRIVGYV